MNTVRVFAARTLVTAGVAALLLVSVATPAEAAVVSLTAAGSGADEVPPAGDDGVDGTFEIDTDAGTLTYTVEFDSDDDAVASHIHQGVPGVAGPIVINLDATAVDEGTTSTVNVDSSILQAIVANPGNYYVNVHTATFPDGAARGQLVGGEVTPSETGSTTTEPTATTTSTAAPTSTTTASSASSTRRTTTSRSTRTPTAVAAGNGGQFADSQGGLSGPVITLILGAGLGLIGTVGAVLARRRTGNHHAR
jgi:hypothetical protein